MVTRWPSRANIIAQLTDVTPQFMFTGMDTPATSRPYDELVDRCIKSFGLKVPGRATARRLAKELGLHPMAISKWRRYGIPPGRVLELERLTGIHRHYLNSKFYPDPPSTSEAA